MLQLLGAGAQPVVQLLEFKTHTEIRTSRLSFMCTCTITVLILRCLPFTFITYNQVQSESRLYIFLA